MPQMSDPINFLNFFVTFIDLVRDGTNPNILLKFFIWILILIFACTFGIFNIQLATIYVY